LHVYDTPMSTEVDTSKRGMRIKTPFTVA
jgi:hypothetical protein